MYLVSLSLRSASHDSKVPNGVQRERELRVPQTF